MMIRRPFFQVLALMALPVVGICVVPSLLGPSPSPGDEGPLCCAIKPWRDPAEPGVTLDITNLSAEPVNVSYSTFFHDHVTFSVFNSDGVLLRALLWEGFSSFLGARDVYVVQPRETYLARFYFSTLERYLDPLPPGRYWLEAAFEYDPCAQGYPEPNQSYLFARSARIPFTIGAEADKRSGRKWRH